MYLAKPFDSLSLLWLKFKNQSVVSSPDPVVEGITWIDAASDRFAALDYCRRGSCAGWPVRSLIFLSQFFLWSPRRRLPSKTWCRVTWPKESIFRRLTVESRSSWCPSSVARSRWVLWDPEQPPHALVLEWLVSHFHFDEQSPLVTSVDQDLAY